MSFVYAEKQKDRLDIHCDTKIEFDSFAGASFSKEQLHLVKKYGIVKITLICPEIGIAFAGNNIYLASKLFKQLYDKRFFSTEDVIDMAYDIHMSSNLNDIEFIVASCENRTLSLHCIKEREKYINCQFAWIGSSIAHCEFQEIRNKNNSGNANERTAMAFLGVVQGCSDETVGGFHISAGYNSVTKSMNYNSCKTFEDSKLQSIRTGENIKFHMDPEDGGFSFEQIPISLENLAITIDQMEPTILYTRRYRMNDIDIKNDQLFSMMLPMIIHKDEYGNWIRL